MKQSKLTIGIPFYNGEKSIAKTIESVLNQTFVDFELIISDNGSTDNTANICLAYAGKDHRIRYLRNENNLGLLFNYDRLLHSAGGEYFARIQCGDYWAMTFAEKCIEALDKSPETVLCYTAVNMLDIEGNVLSIHKDVKELQDSDLFVRYKAFMWKFDICNALLGITRTKHSAKSKFFMMGAKDTTGYGHFVLSELIIEGPFIQLEEPLYFREPPSFLANKKETFEERHKRYFNILGGWSGYGIILPFCNWIKKHCEMIKYSEHSPAEKNLLIQMTYQIMGQRYRKSIETELSRAIHLILKGIFKLDFGEEISSPNLAYTYLNASYITKLISDLEFAFWLIPDFQGIYQAKATLSYMMGRVDEAEFYACKELHRNPGFIPSLQLLEQIKRHKK